MLSVELLVHRIKGKNSAEFGFILLLNPTRLCVEDNIGQKALQAHAKKDSSEVQ